MGGGAPSPKSQRRVCCILDDGDVELGGEIEQPLAGGERQRLARGIGEARYDVGELHAAAGGLRVLRIGCGRAVAVLRPQLVVARLVARECLQRAEVSGRGDECRVARREQQPAEEVEALLRA